MKSHRILPLFAALVMFGSLHARAGDVKIIANPSVRPDSITVTELRSIFLEGQRSLNDGSHVEPVLAKRGPAHDAFLRRYLDKSDSALRNYYRTLVFTGTGLMPKVLASDVEIATYVAATKGAVGYVSDDVQVQGVKVLAILQTGTNAGRRLVTRVEPDYPETLQRLQIGGTVRLSVAISAKGTVDSVQLLGGNPILAVAAIKAVKQWVYAPAPSPTTLEVSISFTPNK
ncbi:MAG TPA: energy transducer TonB [Candidatus Dormibacteraeota bacterium]|nr:energy transducer TonB [Candidatus Dormibacteraeota bacterium]